MNLLDLFRFPAKRSAQSAKERLQIIVQHESARHNSGSEFITKLQKELLDVISKYVNIDPEKIKVQLERSGDYSVLELNVTLPEFHEPPLLSTQPKEIPALNTDIKTVSAETEKSTLN